MAQKDDDSYMNDKINYYEKNPNKGLSSKISKSGSLDGDYKPALSIPRDTEKGFPLLQVKEQYFGFGDLIVKNDVKEKLESIVVENKSSDKLYSYGLIPKRKVLFCGPPGTGKTLSAKIISSEMGYPFVYVMFDSMLSSYLGETATNLRKIFDFIQQGKFVVLFDEFDIVGKKRDDPHEHGEIKRVVNNFMQMMDNYEGESILIAATNHQHLLDTAIWRRFDEIILFDLPDLTRREQLFNKYLRVLRRTDDFTLLELAKKTTNFSAADIAQVCQEALRKSIVYGKIEVNREYILNAISEQKRKKNIVLSKS